MFNLSSLISREGLKLLGRSGLSSVQWRSKSLTSVKALPISLNPLSYPNPIICLSSQISSASNESSSFVQYTRMYSTMKKKTKKMREPTPEEFEEFQKLLVEMDSKSKKKRLRHNPEESDIQQMSTSELDQQDFQMQPKRSKKSIRTKSNPNDILDRGDLDFSKPAPLSSQYTLNLPDRVTNVPRGVPFENIPVLLNIGDKVHGFTVLNITKLSNQQIIRYDLIHDTTKLRLVHLASPEIYNTFDLVLRTPATQGIGVSTATAKMVQMGSTRYNVHRPMASILSMFPEQNVIEHELDHVTEYSSHFSLTVANIPHYFNQVSMLLDGVFSPSLSQLDFMDRWYRIELASDGKINSGGQAFMEKLQSLSETEENFIQQEAMYHLTEKYPRTIHNLPALRGVTHQAVTEYWRQFYRPENCLIITRGDISVLHQLEFVNNICLKNLETNKNLSGNRDLENGFKQYLNSASEDRELSLHNLNQASNTLSSTMADLISDPQYRPRTISASIPHISEKPMGVHAIMLPRPISSEELLRQYMFSYILTSHLDQSKMPTVNFMSGHDILILYQNDTLNPELQNWSESAIASFNTLAQKGFEPEIVRSSIVKLRLDMVNNNAHFWPSNWMNSIIAESWVRGIDENAIVDSVSILRRLESEFLDQRIAKSMIQEYVLDNKHQLFLAAIPDPSYIDTIARENEEALFILQQKLFDPKLHVSNRKTLSKLQYNMHTHIVEASRITHSKTASKSNIPISVPDLRQVTASTKRGPVPITLVNNGLGNDIISLNLSIDMIKADPSWFDGRDWVVPSIIECLEKHNTGSLYSIDWDSNISWTMESAIGSSSSPFGLDGFSPQSSTQESSLLTLGGFGPDEASTNSSKLVSKMTFNDANDTDSTTLRSNPILKVMIHTTLDSLQSTLTALGTAFKLTYFPKEYITHFLRINDTLQWQFTLSPNALTDLIATAAVSPHSRLNLLGTIQNQIISASDSGLNLLPGKAKSLLNHIRMDAPWRIITHSSSINQDSVLSELQKFVDFTLAENNSESNFNLDQIPSTHTSDIISDNNGSNDIFSQAQRYVAKFHYGKPIFIELVKPEHDQSLDTDIQSFGVTLAIPSPPPLHPDSAAMLVLGESLNKCFSETIVESTSTYEVENDKLVFRFNLSNSESAFYEIIRSVKQFIQQLENDYVSPELLDLCVSNVRTHSLRDAVNPVESGTKPWNAALDAQAYSRWLNSIANVNENDVRRVAWRYLRQHQLVAAGPYFPSGQVTKSTKKKFNYNPSEWQVISSSEVLLQVKPNGSPLSSLPNEQ